MKKLLTALSVSMVAGIASAAIVTIDNLDVRGTGVFGHPDASAVTINGVAPPNNVTADPIDVALTYSNLDLDGDATANDAVTFTLRFTSFGGLRAFNQGIDTGYGTLDDVEVSMLSVSGVTTDLGNPIAFDGFTGAAIGAGAGAGNEVDAAADINGDFAHVLIPDNGAFRFGVDEVNFALTPTVLFDNLWAFNGSSLVARTYDLQFSAIPEPATLGLISLCGLALFVRRRFTI